MAQKNYTVLSNQTVINKRSSLGMTEAGKVSCVHSYLHYKVEVNIHGLSHSTSQMWFPLDSLHLEVAPLLIQNSLSVHLCQLHVFASQSSKGISQHSVLAQTFMILHELQQLICMCYHFTHNTVFFSDMQKNQRLQSRRNLETNWQGWTWIDFTRT